jgi:uncharacterized protein with HEPN domain
MRSDRDLETIEKIIRYCDEIDESMEHFGRSFDALRKHSTYRNAVAMCILQVGELTTHLSPGFRSHHPRMPWQDIKGMRNIVAHHYGEFDLEILWDTLQTDIPLLHQYCVEIIRE